MGGKTLDQQLTEEGFKRIAILDNSDLFERIERQIPDLHTYNFRILPCYIANGIDLEDAQPIEKEMHCIYVKH